MTYSSPPIYPVGAQDGLLNPRHRKPAFWRHWLAGPRGTFFTMGWGWVPWRFRIVRSVALGLSVGIGVSVSFHYSIDTNAPWGRLLLVDLGTFVVTALVLLLAVTAWERRDRRVWLSDAGGDRYIAD